MRCSVSPTFRQQRLTGLVPAGPLQVEVGIKKLLAYFHNCFVFYDARINGCFLFV